MTLPVAPTVAKYAELYTTTRMISPRTAQDYRILLDSVILPDWGEVEVTDVKPSDLRVWLTDLWKRAPHQARRSRVILRGIFELAEDDGAIDRSPAARLRLRTAPRARPYALTSQEVHRLIQAMPQRRDRLLTSVMAYGGLRIGEAIALSPGDVSPTGLYIHRSVQPRHGGGWLWGDTKSHQKRMVVLPPGLLSGLEIWAHHRRGKELLFASAAETPIHRGNWHHRVLLPACDRAAVPRISPHDLRATCASLLAASHVPLAAASAHLGHSDTTVTLRHYLAADSAASQVVQTALASAWDQEGA